MQKRMPLINTQFTLFGGHMETVAPGWHWKPEAHLAFELMYIISGTQLTISELGDMTVSAGDMILIPYGVRHNNFVAGQSPMTYFAVHFNFDDPTVRFLLTRRYANRIIAPTDDEYTGLKDHVDHLITLFKDPPQYELTDKLNIQIVMMNLMTFLVNQIDQAGLSLHDDNLDQFLLCQKIADDIKQQLDNQIYYAAYPQRMSLTKIITHYNISPSYALMLFKKYYHQSPQAYLVEQKLNMAKYLLRQPKTQVNEVAERLAYSDPSHFSREFKKHFHVTPKQYCREQAHKSEPSRRIPVS